MQVSLSRLALLFGLIFWASIAQADEFEGKSLAEIKCDPRFVGVAVQVDWAPKLRARGLGAPELCYTDQNGNHDGFGYTWMDLPSSALVSAELGAELAHDWIGYIRTGSDSVYFDGHGNRVTVSPVDFDNGWVEAAPVWVDRRGLERFAEIFLQGYP
jgi:hypothetical protein